MSATPLFNDLVKKASDYDRNTAGANLERLRNRYKQLRDAGLSGSEARIASHWPDERIEQLLNEIA